MASPAALLAGALLAAMPHPAVVSHRGPADVPGRMAPAAIRMDAAAYQDSFWTGICEAALSPIGVILPTGNAGDCYAPPLVLRDDWRDGATGSYVFLDLPPCPDDWCRALQTSDKLRCEILIGNPCCTLESLAGRELQAFPGNRIGPVADALQGRFDSDTDRREGICFAQYTGNQARVLRILIVEPASTQGRATFRVLREGRLFLRSRQGKSDDLTCELVPAAPAE